MRNYYVVKYLVGGYGAYGYTVEDGLYANSPEEAVSEVMKQYQCRLQCVRPVVLGVYIRENGVNTEIEYK